MSHVPVVSGLVSDQEMLLLPLCYRSWPEYRIGFFIHKFKGRGTFYSPLSHLHAEPGANDINLFSSSLPVELSKLKHLSLGSISPDVLTFKSKAWSLPFNWGSSLTLKYYLVLA
jgi:hypothetical protein